ncbi:class I glutamine amidotransferase-like protein [Cerioporus squamosus]|nr:class I glutamine amidotransferase-like protein [Cerioporus squamosus]
MPNRILFVLTSTEETLLGKPTGWYLPEAAHPYYVLAPKYEIDFASPKGPNPPVDKSSIEYFKQDAGFLEDPVVKAKLANAKKLSEVDASDYDAIFYVGGHAPAIDLPEDPDNIRLANEFYRAGKITSAVCHGPAALVNVTDAQGVNIFKGRRATAISNVEEENFKTTKDVPFLVESRIKELGGEYSCSAPGEACVVVDGNVMTGQNPASGKPLAEEIDKALSASAWRMVI